MNNNWVKLDGLAGTQHWNWQVSKLGCTIKLMWDVKSAGLHFFICTSLYWAVSMIPFNHLCIFGVSDILIILCVYPVMSLCYHMDYSLLCLSVHRILQARILVWVAISYTRGSFQCKDQTHVSYVSCIGSQILYHWATWEALIYSSNSAICRCLISLGNKYLVIRMFWTRAEALIFLKRKIFFLLTLFLLFNFLNKSHNSPIRNLLFPVIKIKIPGHPHLHNSFWRLENVKQWMDKWTLTETRMVCQNPLLLQHYSLIHPKIYATRQ